LGGKGLVLADSFKIEGEGNFFRKKLVFFHCVRSCLCEAVMKHYRR
jgi:hypothetical protein